MNPVVNESYSFKDGLQTDLRDYLDFPLTPAALSFGGVVDGDIIRDEGTRAAAERGWPTMVEFARKNREAFADLEQEIQEMGNIFFDYVNGKAIKNTWRYLSDVFFFHDDRALLNAVEILRRYGRSRRDRLFGFSVENDHVHIIHDCNYAANCCRDTFRRDLLPEGSFGPARTENKPIWQFTKPDWYDVFNYFFLRKRGTREIWVNGKSWQKPSADQLVRWTEKLGSWGSLVRQSDLRDADVGERPGDKRSRREAPGTSIDEVYGKKTYSAGKFSYIKSETKALLLKYYVSPVQAIRTIEEFANNNLLSDPKNKDYVQAAFDDFGRQINTYTLREFYQLFSDPNSSPLFMQMDYGDIEQSTEWLDELLKYQFDNDLHQIMEFLTNLVDIIDKKIPKCNTLVIKSPPSAGKNFFFDAVLAILQNYGQLGQANKQNNFAFQEAPNKRILVWNEPNYEAALTDTIKMMLGGDPYTVRVKHNMDTHVTRTPVLVLTNSIVGFMVDLAFADRIIKYEWKAAPFLKDIDKKPYPVSFFNLLNKYNITFYIII